MSKKHSQRSIFVYAHWQNMIRSLPMGVLHSEHLRGKEIFSFEYNPEWIKSEHVQLLDPQLQMYTGIQYQRDKEKSNFGMFLDSSPDRWGRILMRRREAALARLDNRPENHFFETDYLLGVYDEHRMGALRFKEIIEGPYLNDNKEFATPPWTSIRELEEISLKLEINDIVDDPDYLKWLSMLIAPGSSLGGARPKASVLDTKKHLWIAKFPSRNDDTDMGAWEAITYEMALQAGIRMSHSQAKKFNNNHHTFLTKRFDRTDSGERVHFASAMTLLGYNDGQDFSEGASYLELLEFIVRNGADAHADLEELWRRIVFSICVSNTDDHLRNHGFILTPSGWKLSPAYDINPNENGNGLKLNISESDNALEIDLAMEVAPYFRLDASQAHKIVKQVKRSVLEWRKIAKKYGISKNNLELKARAFRQAEL